MDVTCSNWLDTPCCRWCNQVQKYFPHLALMQGRIQDLFKVGGGHLRPTMMADGRNLWRWPVGQLMKWAARWRLQTIVSEDSARGHSITPATS